MKLRYSNTIEDVVAFGRYHRKHSRTHRLIRLVLGWVVPGMLILLALTYLPVSLGSFLFFLIPVAFVLVLVHVVYEPLNGLMIRASLREGDNKGLLGPHELELCPPNLTERNLVGESTRWLGAVEKIGTTATHAFIFVGALEAHVVPRAAVTDGDYDAFVRALEQEMEKARRGRPAPPAWLGAERVAARSQGDDRLTDQPII